MEVSITFMAPEDLAEALERMAVADGRSRSNLIRQLLQRAVDEGAKQ